MGIDIYLPHSFSSQLPREEWWIQETTHPWIGIMDVGLCSGCGRSRRRLYDEGAPGFSSNSHRAMRCRSRRMGTWIPSEPKKRRDQEASDIGRKGRQATFDPSNGHCAQRQKGRPCCLGGIFVLGQAWRAHALTLAVTASSGVIVAGAARLQAPGAHPSHLENDGSSKNLGSVLCVYGIYLYSHFLLLTPFWVLQSM